MTFINYQFGNDNNKYIKDVDKNKESSYITYWDLNKFCGWAMSQKLLVNNFKWIEDTSKFNDNFIKSYNEESDRGYFLKIDEQYDKKLHEFHNDLPLLPERMKIEKIQKVFPNLHYNIKCVFHIRNLKQAINYRLILEKSS